jgi:hypothetical protein
MFVHGWLQAYPWARGISGAGFHHHGFNLFILREISDIVKVDGAASFWDYSCFQKCA